MKRVSLFTMGMALLTLCSCSSDQPEAASSELTPINLFSYMAATRSANASLQKTQIASGVEVGVFAKIGDTYITNGNNNKVTADGNGNFTGTQLFFPSDGSAVSVFAYAPYSNAFDGKDAEAVSFSVAQDQSTDAGYLKSDLLQAVPTGTNSFTKDTPNVPLNFGHKLSKLTVKFTLGETDVNLKGATINILNTLPTTSLKVSDGTLGVASGSATTIKAVTFASDATTFLSSAVIVPQTVSAGEFIQVVLSDKVLNAKLNNEVTFLSGKAYTYNVNISGGGAEAKAEIELASTVTDWDYVADELTGDVTESEKPAAEPITLTATFGTPGNNASYSSPTYTWTGSTSNLMTVFEFSNGELAKYHTLKFKFTNLVDGPVRMGYYVGSTFTEFGSGYYSAGEKTVDLTALGIDLSTVTKISFGGRSNAGSCDILASDVILIGDGEGSSSTDDNNNDEGTSGETDTDGSLTATFGTPGGNATYSAPTYTWTATTNNLMTCFEFSNGELANYKTLTFTISNLSGNMVRMGYYVGSTFTEFGNGFGSNGTKTVDLTALGIDLATVTKISFGGRTGTGSVDIVASDVKLTK